MSNLRYRTKILSIGKYSLYKCIYTDRPPAYVVSSEVFMEIKYPTLPDGRSAIRRLLKKDKEVKENEQKTET